MRNPRKLLYALTNELAILRTVEGLPVWPVPRHVLGSFRATCALFGAEPVQADHLTTGDLPAGDVDVAWLGDGLEPWARVYAHLTRRRARRLGAAAELEHLDSPPAVLITTRDLLSQGLLARLKECSVGATIGIVHASTKDELLSRVLRFSASAVLCGPTPLRRVDIFPYESYEWLVAPSWEVLGSRAPLHALKQAISRGAGMLTVRTHSDGLDARIGGFGGAVVCPLDRPPSGVLLERSPACAQDQHCGRLEISVNEANNRGLLVSPDAFAARILAWHVCFGITDPSAPLDPRWSLVERFLNNPRIGCVISAYGSNAASEASLTALLEALASGSSTGEALAAYNQQPEIRRAGHALWLLGDPAVRLPPSTSDDVGGADPSTTPDVHSDALTIPSPPEVGTDRTALSHGDLTLLRASIRTALALGNIPPARVALNEAAHATLRALDAYELAHWLRQPTEAPAEDGDKAPGPVLRDAVLRLILSGFFPEMEWMPLIARDRVTYARGTCAWCGQPCDIVSFDFGMPHASGRTVMDCPNCQFVADRPACCDLGLSLDAFGGVDLRGAIPERAVAGAILYAIRPFDAKPVTWATTPEGNLRPHTTIVDSWPLTIFKLAVAVVWGTTYAAFRATTSRFWLKPSARTRSGVETETENGSASQAQERRS